MIAYRDVAEIDYDRECTCGAARGNHKGRDGLGECLDDNCGCVAFKPIPRISCGPGRRDRGRPLHLEPLPGDPAGCSVIVRVVGYRRDARRVKANLYVAVRCVCGFETIMLLSKAYARKECSGNHRVRPCGVPEAVTP